VTFSVNEANPTTSARGGSITISASGVTATLTVTQTGAAATLSVSPTSYQWEASGGAYNFAITTNVSAGWGYSGVPDWLTATKSGNTLTLTASANSGAARSGTVTITATGATNATISVSQKAGGPPPSGTWAYSNIYRDRNGQLTFAIAANSGAEQYQGILFRWGSLIGLSPSSNDAWNSRLFIPTEYGTTPSSYANIPYDTGTSDLSSYNAVAGTGDICSYISAKGWVPGSWRMPTTAELQSLYNAGSSKVGSFGAQSATDYDGWTDITFGYNFGSGNNQRFFPAAGERDPSGALFNVGQAGYYWSASPKGSVFAYNLDFSSGYVYPADNANRQFAFPVRCIAE
jgi:uncharacterized protein (TIGR02145 family)